MSDTDRTTRPAELAMNTSSEGHPANANSSSEQSKVDLPKPNTKSTFVQVDRQVRWHFGSPEESLNGPTQCEPRNPVDSENRVTRASPVAEKAGYSVSAGASLVTSEPVSKGTQTLPAALNSQAENRETPACACQIHKDQPVVPEQPPVTAQDQSFEDEVQSTHSNNVSDGLIDLLPTKEGDASTITGTNVNSDAIPVASRAASDVVCDSQSTAPETITDSTSNRVVNENDDKINEQPESNTRTLQPTAAQSTNSKPRTDMIRCKTCLQVKTKDHFYHAKQKGKVVVNCSSCRALTVSEKSKLRVAIKQALKGKEAEAILISHGLLQGDGLIPSHQTVVETLAPQQTSDPMLANTGSGRDTPKDDDASRPKEALFTCRECKKEMPESQFIRHGHSLRSCNNCAGHKPADADKAVQPSQNTEEAAAPGNVTSTETRDILLDKVKDACSQATVPQPEWLAVNQKRQCPSTDGLSDSMKKLKTTDAQSAATVSENPATPGQELSQTTQPQDGSSGPTDTTMSLRGGGGGLVNIRRKRKLGTRSQQQSGRRAASHGKISTSPWTTPHDPSMSISPSIFNLGRDYLAGIIPLQTLADQRGLTSEQLLPEARRSLILYLSEVVPDFKSLLAWLLKDDLFVKIMDDKDLLLRADVLSLIEHEVGIFKEVMLRKDTRRKLINALEQVRADQIDV
ncbi:hypothetical protein G7054_g14980 [Neopestalotiopsis clavispora]|nr:hypothetical protein G7054_g14980 [Neopestalotiopsis clavispora]